MHLGNLFSVFNVVYWVALFVVIVLQGHYVGDTWPEVTRWRFGFVTLFGSTGLMVLGGWDQVVWANLVVSVALTRLVLEVTLFSKWWRTADRETPRWVVEYFAGYLVALYLAVSSDVSLVTWGAMMTSLGIAGTGKVGREMVWQSFRSSKIRQGAADGRPRE